MDSSLEMRPRIDTSDTRHLLVVVEVISVQYLSLRDRGATSMTYLRRKTVLEVY